MRLNFAKIKNVCTIPFVYFGYGILVKGLNDDINSQIPVLRVYIDKFVVEKS